jgi:exonuclease SbcC
LKPIRLQLVGVRSWKTEREVTFDGIDLAAVVGPTGAGKSSILEAIVYALYNASTYDKRGAGSLISSDEKTMSVTLDFEANGEQWRATRSTSRNNYPPSVHKISCLTDPAEHPTVDGERAVNAAIEALIGLDLDQFLTAVLLPQGRFQTLLMATAGERAGILKGVFRLDELDEIRERAVSVRRDQVEPALDMKQTQRSQLLPDPEATLVEASAEVDRCTETVDKLADLKEQHDGFVARTRELDTALTQARQQCDALGAAATAIPSLNSAVEVDGEIRVAEEGLRDAQATHVAQRDQAQARLDDAAAVGVTLQTLATARHVLDTAQKTLPALEANEQTLREAREALVVQQSALDEDTLTHTQHVEQLANVEQNLSALRTSAGKASVELTDATNALRSLRATEEEAVRARGAVTTHEEQLATATASAATVAAQAKDDRSAAEGADTVLGAARQAHQAAHLAAGLQAGEACPVCARELPEGFTPPEAPSALRDAEIQAVHLRKAAEESAAAGSTWATKVEMLKQQLIGLREASERGDGNALGARETAEKLLGLIHLAHEDADLLTALRTASETATSAYETADRELTGMRARLESASENLRQRAESCTSRAQELVSEAERIERERDAQATALAALPEGFTPIANTPESMITAIDACAAKLIEIQELHDGVRTANTEIERLGVGLEELARERAEKIDTPRREAVSSARDIAGKVRELRPDANLPKQPAETAPIADHAVWVKEIVGHSVDLAQALSTSAGEQELASAEAKRQAEEALSAANDIVEETIATADDLHRQLTGWRVRLLTAERDRDKAVEQIPRAALLDTQIEKLRNRRESLEVVSRLLGDGHFIKWLVERRQQLLLVVASEIFAGMTGGRYRFAADFTVIDGRTGIARNPRTLSGGESFMASLSLALAMAEIAARSGGRIGSLYLDEGFGALDPNALDEAITALELRARGGQMILIVSHVEAVAQRIEHVLKVSPDPIGSSAEWLDDEDRESLLVDAASAPS